MRHTLSPDEQQLESIDSVVVSLTAGFDTDSATQIRYAVEWYWAIRDTPSQYPNSILVANQLKSLNVDATTIVAALLGSDVSSSRYSTDDVKARFGVEAATLVDNVRRLNEFEVVVAGSEAQQEGAASRIGTHDRAEMLRRMVLSMVGDIRAVLVKLVFRAQRLHILDSLPPDRAYEVAKETLDVFAPLANRLGIGQIKWEMEDLSFRVLEPQTYKRVAKALEESRAAREIYVRDFVSTLEAHVVKAGFDNASVFGRPKHIYSIWKKMRNKRIEFQDLFDVRAVRVLVDSVQACYTVLGVVHNTWQPIAREFDDYIANPKENGYQSLHTAVIGPGGKAVEVQIRTRQMDREAELGFAAHWSYKEGRQVDEQLQRSINTLRQLLDDDAHDDASLVEDFTQQTTSERVYVFTPKGDVVDLVNGATPLDFAYHVHSEIGHRCRGAKINGSIVPLTTRLTNGDQVDILTTREPSPSRDWLNRSLGYLNSSRARAKVRAWFNVLDHEQHLADGRAILDRELRRAHSRLPLERLTRAAGYEKTTDLYVALARNDITASQLATVIGNLESPRLPEQMPRFKGPVKSSDPADGISVQGVGSLLTQLASCCKPVPYDRIVGYITKSKGVSVHRADCLNMLNLTEEHQARLIEVEWGQESSTMYPVEILIAAYDRQGLLRDVSTVLANEKVNVIGVNTESDLENQMADMKISLYISDMEALSGVMDKIRQLRNVQTVRRIL